MAVCAALAAGATGPREVAPEPLLAKLSAGELRWLNLVDPLITEEELTAFLSLARAYQRKGFIEHFWKARDPLPSTAVNEFHEQWKRRAEVADERYGGVISDRGHAYLLAGPPSFIHKNLCPELLPGNEVWVYRGDGVADMALVFRLSPGPDPYRLWDPGSGLAELVARTRATSLIADELRVQMARTCRRAREVIALLAYAVTLEELVERSEALPKPSPEWVASFLSRSTEVPDSAESLSAELEIAFPGRHMSRTVVQGLIAVPAAEMIPAPTGSPTYNLLVDGEILRGEELFESFRYRFDLPADGLAGGDVPLLIRRHLRPGRYELILRLQDLNSGRFFRTERTLEVPRMAVTSRRATQPRLTPERPAAPAAPVMPSPDPRIGDPPAADALVPAAAGREHLLEIQPLPEHLTIGRQRVDATVTGEGVARVSFFLNGREVMTKRRPPFSLVLDFGRAPRTHVVEAVAYDANGHELARDQLPVNAGPRRFRVRLLEPRAGRSYSDELEAHAEVDLPRGEALDRVEFYLNERKLATLYQPPFTQPVPLAAKETLAYVRAVAVLEDGNSAEDLVIVNAPQQLDQLQVDLVELYATVTDRQGTPVEGLGASDFAVRENQVEQQILRCERAVDLPIHAAAMIDASLSMGEEMREVEEAALTFFRRVIRPEDRAAVIVFSDRPRLRVPLTNRHDLLAGGLSGVLAEGETALYDSVVFGLYYLSGLRGKKALLLLSDGEDSASKYTFDQALDFARHAGIAIYTIGLGLAKNDRDAQMSLRRLAVETGGAHYLARKGSDLARVYERIESELRTQYLIAYQSSLSEEAEGFRQVEVRVPGRDLIVKTIPGYFP